MADRDGRLRSLLVANKAGILDRWFGAVIDTYPADTVRFIKRERDRFANPVGSVIASGLESILEGLLADRPAEDAAEFLDRIIRVRAVQDFSAKDAVSFIYVLKFVIRQTVGDRAAEENLFEDLLELEGRIDQLALLGFDIYSGCREKIWELKATEAANLHQRMLTRLNRKYGLDEEAAD